MNVIVFVLRGCPAGWLGAYGNEWVATPNLDRLAAESVVFDRHISVEPTRDAANREWLRAAKQDGLHAVFVRANYPDNDSSDSFYAEWCEVFDARPQEADASPLDSLIRELPNMLDRVAIHPNWQIWIDVDRLLPPWEVPQEVFEAYIADEGEELEKIEPLSDPAPGSFDNTDLAAWEWLRSSFAAVVTALDAELGSLFDLMREGGLDRTATWVVTSDFGYPLGEHGRIGPEGSELHEELVHLPLIMRQPNGHEAGRRVDSFTQHIPTIADASGSDHAISRFGESGSIRTREWSLIVSPEGSPKLYVKPDDRWEVHDVASLHEEIVQALVDFQREGGRQLLPPT